MGGSLLGPGWVHRSHLRGPDTWQPHFALLITPLLGASFHPVAHCKLFLIKCAEELSPDHIPGCPWQGQSREPLPQAAPSLVQIQGLVVILGPYPCCWALCMFKESPVRLCLRNL